MAAERKRNLFFGFTSRALMTAAAVLLFLSYLSVFVNPAKAWFMTLFGLLYIPLLLLNAVLLLWAVFRRSRAFVIPLLALLPSLFVLNRYVRFPSGAADRSAADSVRIVSYNVGRFALSDGRLSEEACLDSVMRFLQAQDADLICLQEFYMKDGASVGAYLQRRFRGYNVEYFVHPTGAGCFGNVTLSRFPLRSKGKLDFEESSNLAIYGDYDIRGTRLRVYNCHFQSYSISLPRLAHALRGDYREAFRDTERRMRTSIVRRPRQVDQVLRDIDNCPTEAVVVGDFNDTPLSYTYWRLSRGRKDSFVEAGRGFGATYSYFRPFLRIDHILYPRTFSAVSHEVVRKPFSDHYPVVSTLTVSGNPKPSEP